MDFSNNRLSNLDPAGALTNCFANLTDVDVSYNNISQFPSATIYNMRTLENLYFHHNTLSEVPGYAFYNLQNMQNIDFSYNQLTSFELWAFLVKNSADFSFNQITTITNKYFFDMSIRTADFETKLFSLRGNPSINLTDAIYEMYRSCDEVINWLEINGPSNDARRPTLSVNLAYVDFGTIQIDCSCEQSYMFQVMDTHFGGLNFASHLPIYNATCTDGTKFVLNDCPSGTEPVNSSVDFARVYPRFCKVRETEPGTIMAPVNITVPTVNAVSDPLRECRFAFVLDHEGRSLF